MDHRYFPSWDIELQNSVGEENLDITRNRISQGINESYNEILEIPNFDNGYVRCKLCDEIVSAVSFSFHISVKHSINAHNSNIKYLASFVDNSLDREIPILDFFTQKNENISQNFNDENDDATNVQPVTVSSISDTTLKQSNYSCVYPVGNRTSKECFYKNPSGIDHTLIIAELEKIHSSDYSQLTKATSHNVAQEKSYGKIRDIMLLPGMSSSDIYSEFYQYADRNIKHIDNFNSKFHSMNNPTALQIDKESFGNVAVLNAARTPAISRGKSVCMDHLNEQKLTKIRQIVEKVLGKEEELSSEYPHELNLVDQPFNTNVIIQDSSFTQESPPLLSQNQPETTFQSNTKVDINPFNVYDDSERINSARENTQNSENGNSPILMGKSKRNPKYNNAESINSKSENTSVKVNYEQKRTYNTKNRKTNSRGIYFYKIEQNIKSNITLNGFSTPALQTNHLICASNEVNYNSPIKAINNDSFRSEPSTINNSLSNLPFPAQNNISNNTPSSNNFIYNSSNATPDFRNLMNQNNIPIFVNPTNQASSPSFLHNSNNGLIQNNEVALINSKNSDNVRQAYEQKNIHQNNPFVNNPSNNSTNFVANNNMNNVIQIPINQNTPIQQNIPQNIPRNNIVRINNQFNSLIHSNNISNNTQPSINCLIPNNIISNDGIQNINYVQSDMTPNIQSNIPVNNRQVITPHIRTFVSANHQNNINGNIIQNISQNVSSNIINNNQQVIITPTNQPNMILKINPNTGQNLQPNINTFNGSNVCMTPNNMPVNMGGYVAVNPQVDTRMISRMEYSNQINQNNFQQNELNNFQPQNIIIQNNNSRYSSNIIRNHIPNNMPQQQFIVQQPTNIVQRVIVPVQNVTLVNGAQQQRVINVPQNIQFIQNQSNHFNNQQASFSNNQNFQNQPNPSNQLNIAQPQYIIIPQGTTNPNFVQNGRTFLQLSNNPNPQNYNPNVIFVKPEPDFRYTNS